MVRSIVVPLDGSRFAETAIPIARQLARSARAGLHLMLVHESRPDDGAATREDVGRAREKNYLADVVSRIAAEAGPVTDFTVRDGLPTEALVEGIRDLGADLVVMATHGRGSTSPPLSSSLVETLMRTSPAPVLLVRKGQGSAPGLTGWLRSVLAPVALGRDPDPTIAALAAFACLTQAHVTLLHVVAPSSRPVDDGDGREGNWFQGRRETVQRQLDRLADELRARGIAAAARVVVGRDVAATIVDELARARADLVTMSPRRAEDGALRPDDGITEGVLRNATKPVLILPPAPVPGRVGA